MSRGLGLRQREIVSVLRRALAAGFPPLSFAELRIVLVGNRGGEHEAGDRLRPSLERSIKRAVVALVDSKDVVIVAGKGGQKDPYRYLAIEDFAARTGEIVKDAKHAKAIVADLIAAVQGRADQT